MENLHTTKDFLKYIEDKIDKKQLSPNQTTLLNNFIINFTIDQHNIVDNLEYDMAKYLLLGWYISNITKK